MPLCIGLEKIMVKLINRITNQKLIATLASSIILLSLSLPWVSFSILTKDVKFVNYNVTPLYLKITNPKLGKTTNFEWLYRNDATILGVITLLTGIMGIFSSFKKNKNLLFLCGAINIICVILFPSTLPGWFLKMRIDSGIFLSITGSILLIYSGLILEKPANI
jgi:hypothetical protein